MAVPGATMGALSEKWCNNKETRPQVKYTALKCGSVAMIAARVKRVAVAANRMHNPAPAHACTIIGVLTIGLQTALGRISEIATCMCVSVCVYVDNIAAIYMPVVLPQ